MRKMIFIILCFSFLASQVSAQQYKDWRKCPKFSWEKNWEEWAKIRENKEWAAWAKKLQSPKALALGKAWAEYLGYDAVSMVNKSQLAPEIVPGVVINQDNYLQFPRLKEVLPGIFYKFLKKGTYGDFTEIKVAPTQHQYNSWGRLEATKKYEGSCKIASDGQTLLNWVVGIPFPHPKTAAEIAHNYDRTTGNDDFTFNPVTFYIFDRKQKLERIQRATLYWMNYMGRTDLPPKPQLGKGILEKGSLLMTFPFDLKGYTGVRVRYADLAKEDELTMYLPFLRRVRKLSGADTQDPIIGTDTPWEDWKCWWQKLSPKMWPLEYRMVEWHTEVLTPVRWLTSHRLSGPYIVCWWERRPSWCIDVISKTKRYLYSRRRCWMDKERFMFNLEEMYDIRGNLWREWIEKNYWDPETGYFAWWGYNTGDMYNKHRTEGIFEVTVNLGLTDDNFSMGWLRKMAH